MLIRSYLMARRYRDAEAALVHRRVAIVLLAVAFAEGSSTPSAPADARSVAVLPCVDLSPQKDQEYFVACRLGTMRSNFRLRYDSGDNGHVPATGGTGPGNRRPKLA
jgi:hypothetical protein